LDKGSYNTQTKKGSVYVAPLDKGEFVPDPPKLKGSVIVLPTDKGSYTTPKLKGSIQVGALDKGEFVSTRVVTGTIIQLPVITNPPARVKTGKVIAEPLDKGEYGAPTSATTGGVSGGGGGGGMIGGGAPAGGSGGGAGSSFVFDWIWFPTTSGTLHGSVEVGALDQGKFE
jgi:hypothetical protein